MDIETKDRLRKSFWRTGGERAFETFTPRVLLYSRDVNRDEKKKRKKIGNLYPVMIYTCTIYYVFNVTNDHCTVNKID